MTVRHCADIRCFERPLLAQLDREPGFEPGGWGFKSLGAGHRSKHPRGRKASVVKCCQGEAGALAPASLEINRARRIGVPGAEAVAVAAVAAPDRPLRPGPSIHPGS